MANFVKINKASGCMQFINSNGNFSMVARLGAPLFINMRDPFVETPAPVHLQARVYPLPKEKVMRPTRVARSAFLKYEEFRVHTGLYSDPPPPSSLQQPW